MLCILYKNVFIDTIKQYYYYRKFFMKSGIHPTVYDVSVYCTCGNSFTASSTKSELRVTLCSQCHPFYTGAQKFVDTAGRIEKFQNKYKKKA